MWETDNRQNKLSQSHPLNEVLGQDFSGGLPQKTKEHLFRYDKGEINTESFLWHLQQYKPEAEIRDIIGAWNALLGNLPLSRFHMIESLRAADVLVRLIEPTTGLIAPDSSIWEEHWNGNQKHFTYTSTWAVRGLREAADMAERVGDSRAQEYRDNAQALAQAIADQLLTQDGVLVGNLEELQNGDPALDLAAVDAFNNGTLDARSAAFETSYAAWDAELRVPHGRGFMRNDDGDLYDSYEWLMIDLRVAEALRRACRYDEAASLEDWITAQAQANNLIVPELFEPTNGDFAGPAPMMGFGSGLYALQMHTRDALGEECADLDSGNPDTAGPGVTQPDCGCTGGAAGGSWLLGLATLMLMRRRRS